MRIYRIFLLHLQDVFEQRGRTFVWILMSFILPILMILFWRGAKPIPGWSIEQLVSYYFFIVIMGAFIMTHIEERIGKIDIQEGQLTMHLLKPFSYFWLKFFYAVPNRLLQGIFGLLFFALCYIAAPHMFQIQTEPVLLLTSFVIVIGAFFLAFTFKVIVGILAFWMTEAHGLFEMVNILVVVFAGYLMPIVLFPNWLQSITFFSPFPYMIYYPVLAFTGKLMLPEMIQILSIQLIWICVLALLYKIVWAAGIKKFSAIGQ